MNLQIVAPCFNEQEVLAETAAQLDAELARLMALCKVSPDSRIVFVDDGSHDGTWARIEREATARPLVTGIKLSRNYGHQNAVLAGLMLVGGDAVITIDADLQDDVAAIERMVDECAAGCDVVYGVRASRDKDSLFKRQSANLFYRLLAGFGVEMIPNHADFRLTSRRVIEALRGYREVNLYLRGIMPLIGFRSTCVAYDRNPRLAGETKYPLGKMLRLAVEGITSFSTVPLQIITSLGFVVFIGTMVVSAWVLWITFFTDRGVPGWASTVLPMFMLGGIQILCLGVIGAYVGKLYREAKARPRYFVDRTVGMPPERAGLDTLDPEVIARR